MHSFGRQRRLQLPIVPATLAVLLVCISCAGGTSHSARGPSTTAAQSSGAATATVSRPNSSEATTATQAPVEAHLNGRNACQLVPASVVNGIFGYNDQAGPSIPSFVSGGTACEYSDSNSNAYTLVTVQVWPGFSAQDFPVIAKAIAKPPFPARPFIGLGTQAVQFAIPASASVTIHFLVALYGNVILEVDGLSQSHVIALMKKVFSDLQ
jgi:hypothetical protein